MVDKKKTPDEIRSEILSQLGEGPKTIGEIGEAVGSNWLTIEKFLTELKVEGKVIEILSTPKMKVYRRVDDIAFYGLPFSKEIRNKSCSLLFAVANQWKEEKGTIPARTTLQKVAIALIEASGGNLSNIPILRFHYGQTLAVMYNSEAECKPLALDKNQKECLSKLIEEYHCKKTTYAKSKQYQKQGMELYKEKYENLDKALYFSKDDPQKIENSLLKLSIFYPIELRNSFPLFDKFIYCSTILLSLKDQEIRKQNLNKIREIFSLVWDAITTEYFFYDSEKYILPDRKELFYRIRDSILNLKIMNLSSLLEDLESEANSINPKEIESPSDKESLEIRKLFVEGAEVG